MQTFDFQKFFRKRFFFSNPPLICINPKKFRFFPRKFFLFSLILYSCQLVFTSLLFRLVFWKFYWEFLFVYLTRIFDFFGPWTAKKGKKDRRPRTNSTSPWEFSPSKIFKFHRNLKVSCLFYYVLNFRSSFWMFGQLVDVF